MRRRAQTVALLLVALAPSLHGQSKSRDPHEAPEVRKLRFLGADHVDRHDLERSLATEASVCKTLVLEPFCLFSRSPTFFEKHYLDHVELRRDVIRIRVYYWKRGWREVQVDTLVEKDANGVAVTFTVNEGTPTVISALRVDYDSALVPKKRIQRLTTLSVGKPFSLLALDSMRLGLQNEMWDRGYGDAIVDTAIAVNDSARKAAVYLRVFSNWPTVTGDITVRGNKRVATSTIRNTMLLREGQPFRRSDVLESQRNLYESNLFRVASILPPTGDSVKNVEVQVLEAPLREAHVGFGVSSVEFGQMDARLTAYNFFGGARRLDITGSLGNLGAASLNGRGLFQNVLAEQEDTRGRYLQPTWTASVDFRQPSFLRRPRNQFGVGVFAHRQSAPGVYIDRGYGASATLTHQMAPRAPLSLTYRYEQTRVEATEIYFCVNYGVCDTSTVRTLQSHQSLSPIALSTFVDRTDLPFSPTRGYVARLEVEHASRYTASDYRYNRAAFDGAAYYHRSGNASVLAMHLKLGFVRSLVNSNGDTVLHPRKRFYAGGASSVRGYGENQLGPRVLTIPSDSLRGTATNPRCPATTPIEQCDPNGLGLGDGQFVPRPLGGTSLLEGSVEYRVPVMRKVDAAVFVDGAIVGQNRLQTLAAFRSVTNVKNSHAAVTPGFGVRYNSPVGPIRVDLGIRPTLTERIPVVTDAVRNGVRALVPLTTQRLYGAEGKTLLKRLVLHFSIGQAY